MRATLHMLLQVLCHFREQLLTWTFRQEHLSSSQCHPCWQMLQRFSPCPHCLHHDDYLLLQWRRGCFSLGLNAGWLDLGSNCCYWLTRFLLQEVRMQNQINTLTKLGMRKPRKFFKISNQETWCDSFGGLKTSLNQKFKEMLDSEAQCFLTRLCSLDKPGVFSFFQTVYVQDSSKPYTYYPRGNLIDTVFRNNASPGLTRIEHGPDLLKKGIIWRIRDGSKVCIWRDNWLPRNRNLKISSQRGSSRLSRVKQLLIPGRKERNTQLIARTFLPHDADQILNIRLSKYSLRF